MAGIQTQVAPSVLPTAAPPNDYQQVNPTPAAFGGTQAAGFERLGQGVEQASSNLFDVALTRQRRFNEIASTSAFNQLQDSYRNATFGDPDDPSKPGFFQLRGQAALDAYPTVSKQLEMVRQSLRKGLQNDDQRLQFDQASRRLQSYTLSDVGRHYDNEFHTWGSTVAKAQEQQQTLSAANNYTDDAAFSRAIHDARMGRMTFLQSEYRTNNLDPAVVGSNLSQVDTEMVKARAISWGERDPLAAMQWLETGALPQPNGPDGKPVGPPIPISKTVNPETLATLKTHLRTKADDQAAVGLASPYTGLPGTRTGAPLAPVVQQINDAATQEGVRPQTALATARIESDFGRSPDRPGSSYTGMFQLSSGERAASGTGNEVRDGVKALKRAGDTLGASIGRTPEPWEVYLAHQQGVAGAAALLQADPNTPAADVLVAQTQEWRGKGRDAALGEIVGNIPEDQRAALGPNPTVGQFTSLWRARFQRAEAEAQTEAPADRQQALEDVVTRAPTFEAGQKAMTMLRQRWELQDHQQRRDEEAAGDEWLKKLLADPTKVSREAILQDGRLGMHTREHLVAMLDGATNGDTAETRRFGNGFWDLHRRILLPYGDPKKLTDIDEVYKQSGPGGAVTIAGAEKLVDEIKGRRSEEGVEIAERQGKFLEAVRKEITGSNDQFGIRDPIGDEQFDRFLASFYAAKERIMKEGKVSPTQLFDPDSKVSVWPLVKLFKRSDEQRMRDINQTTPAQPAGPRTIPGARSLNQIFGD